MKEFLAMVLAFITSLSTSTEFRIVDDKPYTSDYYTVEVSDPPDYREFHGSGESASSEVSCKTTVYTAQGKRVENSSGFWIANNQTYTLGSLPGKVVPHKPTDSVVNKNRIDYYTVKKCFTEGTYIIMPYTGELKSPSSNKQNNSITVTCQNPDTMVRYKLNFCAMRCWYCDISRKGALSKESEEGSMYHTSDDKEGKKFPAGTVLGVATDNTYFQIVPIDSDDSAIGTATLEEFYAGSYTKYKKK